MSRKSFSKVLNELTQGYGNTSLKRIYSTSEIIQRTLQSVRPSGALNAGGKEKRMKAHSKNNSVQIEMTSLSYILKAKGGGSNRPIVNLNKKRLDFSPDEYLSHCNCNSRIMITSNIVRKYAKNINTKKKSSNTIRKLLLVPNENNKNSFEKYIKELTEYTPGLKLFRSEYH